MKLALIRHGKTEGNLKRLYYGSTDLPLLEEGVEELKALKNMGGYPEAKRYFTSGMLRTEQTFEILFGDRPHEKLEGLREIDCGDFEMRSFEELKDDPAYMEWIKGDIESNICPNGESYAEVTKRAMKALEPIIAAGEDALAVTHGGIIGSVMRKFFPDSTRYDFRVDPGFGYTVEFVDGKPISMKKVPIDS